MQMIHRASPKYMVIAVLAVAILLSLPEVSFYLEKYMHKIIGPTDGLF
jgi:hypothetical protein